MNTDHEIANIRFWYPNTAVLTDDELRAQIDGADEKGAEADDAH